MGTTPWASQLVGVANEMFSLFDLLEMHGIEVRPGGNENEYKINCLFCVDMGTSQDTRFRLGFNLESGLGHCYNCGWSSRKAVLEIVKKLGALIDEVDLTEKPFTLQTRKRPDPVKLPEGLVLLSEVEEDDDIFGPALKYVLKRGVTHRQLKKYKVGASVTDDRCRYRVVFPIRDAEKKLLGYVARDWTGHQDLPYLNSVGTKSVWNSNMKGFSEKLGIVSEGIFKALAIERATGYKYRSSALNGNTITNSQLMTLKGPSEIVLFPDPGKAGIDGFLGVAQNLITQFDKVTVAWPWPEKQADELTPKEIRNAIRGRKLYTTFFEWEVRKIYGTGRS